MLCISSENVYHNAYFSKVIDEYTLFPMERASKNDLCGVQSAPRSVTIGGTSIYCKKGGVE
jgi:hypothetical protein